MSLLQACRTKGVNVIQHGTLFDAIINNDVDAVKALLEEGANPNVKSAGQLPLHVGARMDARMRGIYRCSVRLEGEEEEAQAQELCRYLLPRWRRHTQITELLLAAGADPNKRDSDGNTPLSACVQGLHPAPGPDGSLLWLKEMEGIPVDTIEAHVDLDGIMMDRSLRTTHAKDRETVDLLLRASSKKTLEARDERGRTAEEQVVEQLAAAKAYAHKRGDSELELGTLLHLFRQDRARRLVLEAGPDLCLRNRNGATGLHLAARDGDCEEIARQLDAGITVNDRDLDGTTPLMEAAANGRREAAELLLDRGAALLAQNNYGDRVTHIAARDGQPVVADFLLRAITPNKKLLEAVNDEKETPLLVAVTSGRLDMVGTLISAGADVEANNREGNTSLCWAAISGHLETCKALLNAGADPNARNTLDSYSLLQTAVRNFGHSSSMEIIDLLIERGARVTEGVIFWAGERLHQAQMREGQQEQQQCLELDRRLRATRAVAQQAPTAAEAGM